MNRSHATRKAVVLLLILPAAIGVAAHSAKDPTTKGDTVLRVETRLIEVNVVAQDSKGRAVKDLTRDDFRLSDNGKEVPVDVFASEFAETTSPAITTLPPNTFTNRVKGVPPSVTIILLDGLNTSFEDQTWARSEVIRFLENLQPQDRVAIFLLGDHLYVLQNFTSDPKVLLAVLKSKNARIPLELQSSTLPPPPAGAAQTVDMAGALQQLNANLPSGPGAGGATAASSGSIGATAAQNAQAQEEAIMAQFEGHRSSFYVMDRVYRTMAALMAIANFLKQFPGRKNLIWVSAGFPIAIGFDTPRSPGDTRDQVHFTPELERAFKALNNADLAVYPVDARGLVATDPRGMDMNNFYSTQGAMEVLADHTGGRAFFNTNDIARVIRTAVDDSEADYALGFYPHSLRWDGKYHELKVKVTRPGIHLRYRQGYYAALDAPRTEEQANALIQRAINSPLDTTGLGLTVTLEKSIQGSGGQTVLGIVIDARNITFHDKNGDKTVEMEMVFAQSGADGKILNASRAEVNMRVAGDGLTRLMSRGLRLKKSLAVVEGATTLELVVRDPASGNIGSVRIPLGT